MPVRTADATWTGGLKDGNGNMRFGGGAFDGQYSFVSRFEDGEGTNPEELIAAAHAGCYSMALSAGLENAGYDPEKVTTQARLNFEKTDAGFRVTSITLVTEASVPGIEAGEFAEQAEAAKDGCPVSNALNPAINIEVDATLL